MRLSTYLGLVAAVTTVTTLTGIAWAAWAGDADATHKILFANTGAALAIALHRRA